MTYQEYIFYFYNDKTNQIEKHLIKLSCNYPPPFIPPDDIEKIALRILNKKDFVVLKYFPFKNSYSDTDVKDPYIDPSKSFLA